MDMGTKIGTTDVFERALALPTDERRQLAAQLLGSLDEEPATSARAEEIAFRFKALDERFVAAVAVEVQRRRVAGDDDTDFASRLA
jgi:hypothetical protein